MPINAILLLKMAGLSKLEVSRKTNADGTAGWSTYAGGNFCGPGWGFFASDVTSGTLTPAAVDAIDQACKNHDECYGRLGYLTQSCNVRLASELTAIVVNQSMPAQMRIDAAIMSALFGVEAYTVDQPKAVYENVRALFIEAGMSMERAIYNAMLLEGTGFSPVGGR